TGMLVVHTREGHLPDLSDAPPAKVERGAPSKRIGDPGPMGRILVRGEAGHDIIPELYPLDSEIVIDKPGKGAFYATELGDVLQRYGIENLPVCGVTTEVCVNTTVREATGRSDVCALPSGVSVPHMFIVTFVIMLPITLKTGDPIKGWSAGLVWVFFQSFILMIGGFIAPYIRKITPRAALLGTLAGVSVTFISMRPALEMYMTPQIGLVCFAIILVSWFGGVKYPKGIPAGLMAIAVGMIIAWGSNLFGLG